MFLLCGTEALSCEWRADASGNGVERTRKNMRYQDRAWMLSSSVLVISVYYVVSLAVPFAVSGLFRSLRCDGEGGNA